MCIPIYCTLSTIFPFVIEIASAIIVVIGILVTNQYEILSFPPRQCVEGGRNFYNYVLPANFICVIAYSMLVVIVWNIYKVGFYVMSPPSVTKKMEHSYLYLHFTLVAKDVHS